MPLTSKGKAIKAAMDKEYGEEKGEKVFYASKNKGTIKGVEKKSSAHKALRKFHKDHEMYTDKKKHLKMCKGCDSKYHKE